MALIKKIFGQKWIRVLLLVLFFVFAAVVLGLLIREGYKQDWTGFNYTPDINGQNPGKYLWDWMELLIIPLVLALLGVWYSNSQKKNEMDIAAKEREVDREIAEASRNLDLSIAEDRLQEATLQSFLDKITDLILTQNLQMSETDSGARIIARARTITTIRSLNYQRNRILFSFLREAGLICGPKASISLKGADLSSAQLQTVNLSGLDLRGIILNNANLSEANISNSDLRQTSLFGTDLSYSEISNSNFEKANLHLTNFYKSNLSYSIFDYAVLIEPNMKESCLSDVSFKESIIIKGDFSLSNIGTEQLSFAKKVDNCIIKNGTIFNK